MPEIKKVEIETAETPPSPAPPSDKVLDLAVEVGQMRAESQATRGELIEVKSGLAQACDLIRSQNEMIQGLRSQTNRAEERAESAQATAAVAIAEATEEEEGAGGLLEVVPEVETRVEITQTPVKSRRWFHNLIYGK